MTSSQDGVSAVVATCSLNQCALDFDGNLHRIIDSIKQAKIEGARYRLGPELEVSGFSCGDAFLQLDTYLHCDQSLAVILGGDYTDGILCDIGCPILHNNRRYNCRVVCLNRKILLVRPMTGAVNGQKTSYRKEFFDVWRPGESVKDDDNNTISSLDEHFLSDILRFVTKTSSVPFGNATINTKDFTIASCFEVSSSGSSLEQRALAIRKIIDACSRKGAEIFAIPGASCESAVEKFWIHPRSMNNGNSAVSSMGHGNSGAIVYSNLRGCDGGMVYFDGGADISLDGKVVSDRCSSSFTLRDVTVVTAEILLSDLRTRRQNQQQNNNKNDADGSEEGSHIEEGSLTAAGSVPVASIHIPDFALSEQRSVTLPPRIETIDLFREQKNSEQQEGANENMRESAAAAGRRLILTSACWLWDYLRRTRHSTFLSLSILPPDGSTGGGKVSPASATPIPPTSPSTLTFAGDFSIPCGLLLSLEGDVPSAVQAVIVKVMCMLAADAARQGDRQVIEDMLSLASISTATSRDPLEGEFASPSPSLNGRFLPPQLSIAGRGGRGLSPVLLRLQTIAIELKSVSSSPAQGGHNQHIPLLSDQEYAELHVALCHCLLHTIYMGSGGISNSGRGRDSGETALISQDRAYRLAEALHSYHHTVYIDDITSTLLKVFTVLSGGKMPKSLSAGGSLSEDWALARIQSKVRSLFAFACAHLLPWLRKVKEFGLVSALTSPNAVNMRSNQGDLGIPGNERAGASPGFFEHLVLIRSNYTDDANCSSSAVAAGSINLCADVSLTVLRGALEWAAEACKLPIFQEIALAANPEGSLGDSQKESVSSATDRRRSVSDKSYSKDGGGADGESEYKDNNNNNNNSNNNNNNDRELHVSGMDASKLRSQSFAGRSTSHSPTALQQSQHNSESQSNGKAMCSDSDVEGSRMDGAGLSLREAAHLSYLHRVLHWGPVQMFVQLQQQRYDSASTTIDRLVAKIKGYFRTLSARVGNAAISLALPGIFYSCSTRPISLTSSSSPHVMNNYNSSSNDTRNNNSNSNNNKSSIHGDIIDRSSSEVLCAISDPGRPWILNSTEPSNGFTQMSTGQSFFSIIWERQFSSLDSVAAAMRKRGELMKKDIKSDNGNSNSQEINPTLSISTNEETDFGKSVKPSSTLFALGSPTETAACVSQAKAGAKAGAGAVIGPGTIAMDSPLQAPVMEPLPSARASESESVAALQEGISRVELMSDIHRAPALTPETVVVIATPSTTAVPIAAVAGSAVYAGSGDENDGAVVTADLSSVGEAQTGEVAADGDPDANGAEGSKVDAHQLAQSSVLDSLEVSCVTNPDTLLADGTLTGSALEATGVFPALVAADEASEVAEAVTEAQGEEREKKGNELVSESVGVADIASAPSVDSASLPAVAASSEGVRKGAKEEEKQNDDEQQGMRALEQEAASSARSKVTAQADLQAEDGNVSRDSLDKEEEEEEKEEEESQKMPNAREMLAELGISGSGVSGKHISATELSGGDSVSEKIAGDDLVGSPVSTKIDHAPFPTSPSPSFTANIGTAVTDAAADVNATAEVVHAEKDSSPALQEEESMIGDGSYVESGDEGLASAPMRYNAHNTEPLRGTVLLIIDPQIDYHPSFSPAEGEAIGSSCGHPEGAVPVPTANADSERIAALIRRALVRQTGGSSTAESADINNNNENNKNNNYNGTNAFRIDHIVVCLQSKHFAHISHPAFWVDSSGRHPGTYTIISSDDVESCQWMPASATSAGASEEDREAMKEWCVQYLHGLEDSEGCALTIWPEHCVVGTPGHAIVPVINSALQEWAGAASVSASGGAGGGIPPPVNYFMRGYGARSEMMSVFRGMVNDPSDPSTALNLELLDRLNAADRVLVCGQTLSHSVNYSLRDLVQHWVGDIRKVVFLTDASSCPSAYEDLGEELLSYLELVGVTCTTTSEI